MPPVAKTRIPARWAQIMVAATVVEPCSNGLGSDAFCILWDGERLHGLNASGPAPAAWTPEYFRRKLLRWREEILRGSGETLRQLKEEDTRLPDAAARDTRAGQR